MFMSWPYGARSEQQYEANIFMGINIANNFLKNHSWTCDSCKRSGPWASCVWKEDSHYGDVLFLICSCSCNVTPVENCNIMPFSPTVNWCNVNIKKWTPISNKTKIPYCYRRKSLLCSLRNNSPDVCIILIHRVCSVFFNQQ